MTKATILLSGRLVVTKRVEEQVRGSRIIAADSGIAHVETLKITPDLWVGDFDSASDSQLATYAHVPKHSFSRAKDVSDGALAVGDALDHAATSICLAGAFGGRSDHLLTLLLSMFSQQLKGIHIFATSGDEEALPLVDDKLLKPDWPQGSTFSVLPITDLKGLAIKGASWPLEQRDVPLGSTLTLSNIVDGKLQVSLKKGRALIIAQLG